MSTFVESAHPRGQAGNAGQFRDKVNDAPTGALSSAPDVDPSEWLLEDIGLGVEGESFVLASALSEEPFAVYTDNDHHDQAVAVAYAIARLRGVQVEAPHHTSSAAQMITSGRAPSWSGRPNRHRDGETAQELGEGEARVSWGEDGVYHAWGRDGTTLGEFESLPEAQRAVSASLMEPGALPRADGGVLLLDDATEFSSTVLDALRQPMETGRINVSRAGTTRVFDADAQVALVVRKCPCGEADAVCRCTPAVIRRHLSRLSGPILDRVPAALRTDSLSTRVQGGLTEDDARTRIAQARAAESSSVALRAVSGSETPRLRGVPAEKLRALTRASSPSGMDVIDDELTRGRITLRRADKAVRRAWALAFLDGVSEGPSARHITQAIAQIR